MIIPTHVQIETINGVCNARCVMCTRESWIRPARQMTMNEFKTVLDKLSPYRDRLCYLTLHFCAEPLLDTDLPARIQVAKQMGFRGTGFATNCALLEEELARKLIQAGLDTIICSVDGVRKETHEAIRVGTNFDAVRRNVLDFIRIRNELAGPTRILVRFIRQELNAGEWPAFREYWGGKLNPDYGDGTLVFDVHNWAGQLEEHKESHSSEHPDPSNLICDDLWDRFVIFSNGDVGLCCADENGFFKLGNVFEADPMEIYNNNTFAYYRKTMKKGLIGELEHCRECTIPRSRALKESLQ